MTYEIFKKELVDALKLRLPSGVCLKQIPITKNNGTQYDGISFITDENCAAPTLYCNDLYEQYKSCQNMDRIVDETILNISNTSFSFKQEDFLDFDKIKNHLCLRLINTAMNEELLSNSPHMDFCDLSLVCSYYNQIDGAISSFIIQNSHLKLWDLTVNEILSLSTKNSENIIKPCIKSISEIIKNFIPETKSEGPYPPVYVVSNSEGNYGAVCITYPSLLKELSDKLSSSLALIPSSVHEFLIMPCDDKSELEKITEMVQAVNSEAVLDKDILGTHAYYYDRASGLVSY